ncbi:uncharacterized protein LOC129601227 [Paramacrobiotus metropolitanus]|uniref:uncharacterized protein LOC129601227 n=1 Tax=Paramacrobiotus metropolitanus TaxID=2943436 RepID=UPI002445B6D1|nr:uncharacterized protein LOC129601227 [Paramacrobiotus metropolitanus]
MLDDPPPIDFGSAITTEELNRELAETQQTADLLTRRISTLQPDEEVTRRIITEQRDIVQGHADKMRRKIEARSHKEAQPQPAAPEQVDLPGPSRPTQPEQARLSSPERNPGSPGGISRERRLCPGLAGSTSQPFRPDPGPKRLREKIHEQYKAALRDIGYLKSDLEVAMAQKRHEEESRNTVPPQASANQPSQASANQPSQASANQPSQASANQPSQAPANQPTEPFIKLPTQPPENPSTQPIATQQVAPTERESPRSRVRRMEAIADLGVLPPGTQPYIVEAMTRANNILTEMRTRRGFCDRHSEEFFRLDGDITVESYTRSVRIFLHPDAPKDQLSTAQLQSSVIWLSTFIRDYEEERQRKEQREAERAPKAQQPRIRQIEPPMQGTSAPLTRIPTLKPPATASPTMADWPLMIPGMEDTIRRALQRAEDASHEMHELLHSINAWDPRAARLDVDVNTLDEARRTIAKLFSPTTIRTPETEDALTQALQDIKRVTEEHYRNKRRRAAERTAQQAATSAAPAKTSEPTGPVTQPDEPMDVPPLEGEEENLEPSTIEREAYARTRDLTPERPSTSKTLRPTTLPIPPIGGSARPKRTEQVLVIRRPSTQPDDPERTPEGRATHQPGGPDSPKFTRKPRSKDKEEESGPRRRLFGTPPPPVRTLEQLREFMMQVPAPPPPGDGHKAVHQPRRVKPELEPTEREALAYHN